MDHLKRTFEYGGYHFTPESQLPYMQLAVVAISKNLSSDFEMGLTKYAWNSKYPWSADDFYQAAGECYYDLFRCEENGKIYIPGENELFLYCANPKG